MSQTSRLEAEDRLRALYGLSLVQRGRAGRYRPHPLLCDYAREKHCGDETYERMVRYFQLHRDARETMRHSSWRATTSGYSEQALTISREIGDQRGKGIYLGNLGQVEKVMRADVQHNPSYVEGPDRSKTSHMTKFQISQLANALIGHIHYA